MNKQNSEYFFFHQYSWPSFWYLKLDSVLISYQVLNGHFCFVQVFSNSLPFLTSIFYQITMEIPLTSKNCSQADISRRFFSREKQIFLVSFFFNIPGISTQIQKPANTILKGYRLWYKVKSSAYFLHFMLDLLLIWLNFMF